MAIRVEYLADHPAAAPLLAAWHHAEWAGLLPGWTPEHALAELRTHTGRRQVPTTLVALEGDSVLGSASLLAADLAGWEHLTPWLASVYVVPGRRRAGLGRLLVGRAAEVARDLGFPALFLWTAGQRGFYERMGWAAIAQARQGGAAVAVMRRELGG